MVLLCCHYEIMMLLLWCHNAERWHHRRSKQHKHHQHKQANNQIDITKYWDIHSANLHNRIQEKLFSTVHEKLTLKEKWIIAQPLHSTLFDVLFSPFENKKCWVDDSPLLPGVILHNLCRNSVWKFFFNLSAFWIFKFHLRFGWLKKEKYLFSYF